MKLVKIENKWINPDAIEVIDKLDGITVLVMRSNNTITIQQPIEKVLQAIEGSQEHKYFLIDKKGNIKNANC
ncbi:hypothetical protein SIN07_05730 [Pediococcus inopinatus]|uniref:hypothetical protein n=1 Tax=Pediococcus inopinatus TaxID=114090 RepID=UPI002A6B0F24|nr:hypothetical protein [Pediococcus inopinatus]WPP08545.1 hypothetical protein SIN07_05730 [Pediococcus inopinatus]